MDGKSVSEVVHDAAKDLHEIGLMSDKELRKFDILCERPCTVYTPAQIKRIRKKTDSCPIACAAYLNVSTDTVRRWERGESKPQGASLRLLHIVDREGLDPLI